MATHSVEQNDPNMYCNALQNHPCLRQRKEPTLPGFNMLVIKALRFFALLLVHCGGV